MDMLPSFSGFSGFVLLVLGFGFIIFVHELGHFLVAKAVGIKCPQFAIGFGGALLSFRKGIGVQRGSSETDYEKAIFEKYVKEQESAGVVFKEEAEVKIDVATRDRIADELGLSETEYRLNWMPLGGYVKMLGQEDLDPNAASDDPRSYNSKPIWARACVISAGVVMNIIFGILFFIIAFMGGFGVNKSEAGNVNPRVPAAAVYAEGHEGDPKYLGVRTGDIIKIANGVPAMDFSDVRIESALAKDGEKVRLVVERTIDGKTEELTFPITPRVGGIGLLEIGIDIPISLRIPAGETKESEKALRGIYPKKDLFEAGVRPGMEVISAAGKDVANLAEFMQVLGDANGQPVDVVFKEIEGDKQATVQIDADPWLAYDTKLGAFHLVGLTPAVRIDGVVDDSPAAKAGVTKGDIVARVGVTPWPSNRQISETVKGADGAAVTMELVREGKRVSLEITPDSDNRLGIFMSDDGDENATIRETLKGSLAASLDLPDGTKITSINGEAVTSLVDAKEKLIQLATANTEGFEFELGYVQAVKDAQLETKTLKTDDNTMASLQYARWRPPMTRIFSPDLMLLKTSSPVEAMSFGLYKTKRSIQQVYLTLLRLTQGTVPLSGMQGPIGIADTGTRIAKRGLTYLFFFLGLISINLAVINFLPIPIVDGGHMVFLLIEKIKGSPVGPKFQAAALYAGLALIGVVFLYVTFHDIARIFGRLFA